MGYPEHARRKNPDTSEGASSEQGMALITSMLVMMLTSAILVGFAMTVTSDQRVRAIDRDRTQAFYGAQAGLEQMTADLAALFDSTLRPTGAQVRAIGQNRPSLPHVSFVNRPNEPGYDIQFPADAQGNPVSEVRTITSGPFQGFVGQLTPYALAATAQTSNGAQVRVTRTIQTVSIPAFQFGIFSELDLSFLPMPDFDFGGRVHTNGNIFLTQFPPYRQVLSDRVTVAGEVIRTHQSNGYSTSSDDGDVNITTTPGSFRALRRDEGSLVGTLGSAPNEPKWTNVSISTYNGNIRNGRTGARRIDLPLVRDGATAIELIRRPDPRDPDTTFVLQQRFYSMASLRILLSDTADDIRGLPGVTGTAPVNLAALNLSGYVVDATHPPIAIAGPAAQGYRVPVGTPLISGFLKIEMQRSNGSWTDVTLQILNRGIAGRNLTNGNVDDPDRSKRHNRGGGGGGGHATCTNVEPNPDAIIRLQRVRDNPATFPPCGVRANPPAISPLATDYWPNVLYDTREGNLRDNESSSSASLFFAGLMHYVELDVRNLTTWLRAQGAGIMQETGYVVYFSDRRGNRDAANRETGEFGFEDNVNPQSSEGTPNNRLDPAEDVNGDRDLDTYGVTPRLPAGATAPLTAAARPWHDILELIGGPGGNRDATTRAIAKTNPPIFFRRALKLTNGARGNVIEPGLTVAAENPVYVEGDFNADVAEGSRTFDNAHSAAAIIADSVTMLSNNWNDLNSLLDPHDVGSNTRREASDTTYRVAIVGGKNLTFPYPTNYSVIRYFGTDGGIGNFLRFLEDWGDGDKEFTYRGSIVSFYASRQAVGTFKCCNNVYQPPRRVFDFDTDFLDPALLPPRTPAFRDVNATGFAQVVRPMR
jgi:hypothetical protein